MSTAVMGILFLVVAGIFAILPLLPAVREWRQPTDAEPLMVGQFSATDSRRFARGFRVFVEQALAGQIARSRLGYGPGEGILGDGTPYVIPDASGRPPLSASERVSNEVRRLVAAPANVRLWQRKRYLREVYADGDVRVGDDATVRAAMARGDIHMGVGSRSLRWLHADGRIVAASGSVLHGRATADGSILLRPGARFERLNAPRIEFASTDEPSRPVASMASGEPSLLDPGDVPDLVSTETGRWLVEGDLEIPAGSLVEADVVAVGACRIGEGSRVVGSVKAHGDLVLEAGVRIDGSAVSERSLRVGPGSEVHGPALAEDTVDLHDRTVLGTVRQPTTVSAPRVRAGSGVVVHGTVWARVGGLVAGPLDDTGVAPRKGREEAA